MSYIKNQDKYYMSMAIQEGRKALIIGEIPVGAVIVQGDKIISTGYNTRETERNPMGHAEINAIKKASIALKDWRLSDCTIYVTLEPCPMCCGAIINSRISKIVYGAKEPKTGCLGSVCNMDMMPFPHTVYVTSGIMEDECKKLMQEFFVGIRKDK